MIVQQTLKQATPTRHSVNKPQFVGFVTDLIVPVSSSVPPRPQAFLVEQGPHWTLPTHFHQEHQFQVFVSGGGTIGKSRLGRLAVHYASPHSGYGPLISGDEGISYLTLRAVGDSGAWYLPEQREHLQLRIKKQQAHAVPAFQVSLEQLRCLPQATEETLIELDSGGLAAWLVRLPPGGQALPPAVSDVGGGRFYVVTQGSLRIATQELPALATVFVSRDDSLDFQSGRDGLEILVLQFPLAAAASFVESMASPPA